MPEESKKGADKKKHDPKEQRRPRQRHQAAAEKKAERKPEDVKTAPKVTVPQKPVYEPPPPEFFKNLKRETDDILKITEEESNKYKKKEIQSNWTKYEMPIETYEEIEEQENLGADYEKLIQAPLSVGGHFQFKHEKSWDVNTGPTLYDKYFDINMVDLNVALCTIPFYERNAIDLSMFSQTDILTMNNRTARFKQKYFNDKSYATAETEAQDKILRSLREKVDNSIEKDTESDDIQIGTSEENRNETKPSYDKEIESEVALEIIDESLNVALNTENIKELIKENIVSNESIIFESKENTKIISGNIAETNNPEIEHKPTTTAKDTVIEKPENKVIEKSTHVTEKSKDDEAIKKTNIVDEVIDDFENNEFIFGNISKRTNKESEIEFPKVPVKTAPAHKAEPPKETKKPVIESPEDLEKWLDDFLDG